MAEVRQGTLGVDRSWLRSDREHCASRVAVEEEEERKGGGEEQATDIKFKSNNPQSPDRWGTKAPSCTEAWPLR